MSEASLETPVITPEAQSRTFKNFIRGVGVIVALAGTGSAVHYSQEQGPAPVYDAATPNSFDAPGDESHFFHDEYLNEAQAHDQDIVIDENQEKDYRVKDTRFNFVRKQLLTVAWYQKAARREHSKLQASSGSSSHSKQAPPTATVDGKIPYDYDRLMRLHNCEQGDEWYANGGNPADPGHQTFQGGLGMSTVAWRMAREAAAERGVTLPESALKASPDQQMQGAQALGDKYGWGGWAKRCREAAGF